MATKNPFRPGIGQAPPFLAGRKRETEEFKKLLTQNPILKNLVITGLKGVGKTALLTSFKSIAIDNGYFWAGSNLSESVGESEQALSLKLLKDLSHQTFFFPIDREIRKRIEAVSNIKIKEKTLTYDSLLGIYQNVGGLEIDKLKAILPLIWEVVKPKAKGIVLAYDEAQLLKNKAAERQHPFTLLLDVIQYLQLREIPYFLVLTGLPDLVGDLHEARGYSERMFHIANLGRLTPEEAKDAIVKPIEAEGTITFSNNEIQSIIKHSHGYPYLIQFFCYEAFDTVLQQIKIGEKKVPYVDVSDFAKELDADFYGGKWNIATDRQRELMTVIAKLPNANDEFAAKEISDKSKEILPNPFSLNHVNNTLVKLIEDNLVFKNRRGKYSFALPMLAEYIKRQSRYAISIN